MSDSKSPVHRRAEALGIPVHTPVNFKSDSERARFAAFHADAAVVVAYGLILPQAILEAPRLGCYNVHASKLPRWRGAAPIQRAIMAGDTVTGVAIMRMEAGLDTGPVCLSADVAIPPDMTAGQLHDLLSHEGARLMAEALAQLEAGTLASIPQPDEGATYAAKIDKGETRIDFSATAGRVVDHIRGLSPFPGAWFEISGGSGKERIKVLLADAVEGAGAAGSVLDDRLTIACGKGAVRLREVQRAGRKAVSAVEFLRGFPVPIGTRIA